jgi:hypothetical protein
MKLWPWILGLLGFGAVVGARASSDDDDDDDDPAPSTGTISERHAKLRAALASIGELDATQRAFLEITAYGESKFNPAAHNNSFSERSASARGADHNPSIKAKVTACGVDPETLRTGSWGMFQRLAPFLAGDAFEIFGDQVGCGFCDPTKASYGFQIVSALETARDLQGYPGFQAKQTVGNLRLGWAAPTLMGYLSANAKKIAKYREQAEGAGYGAGLIDATINRFPQNIPQIYGRLVQAGFP